MVQKNRMKMRNRSWVVINIHVNDNYVRLLFWVLFWICPHHRNVLSWWFLLSLKSSCKVLKDWGSETFTFPNAVLVECAFIMKHGWWNDNLAHSSANRPSDFKKYNFAGMWSNTNQWLKKICVSALINHFLYLQNRDLEWLLSWNFRCWFEWFIATIWNNALCPTHVLYIYLFAHKLKWTSFHNAFSIG